MLAEIATGVGALKSLSDIIKGLSGTITDQRVKEIKVDLLDKIIDAQGALLAAQESQSTLTKRIEQLETELVGLKNWDAEKANYELKDLYGGRFVYLHKEAVNKAENRHFLCTKCFDKGHRSILQNRGANPAHGGEHLWHCFECGLSFGTGRLFRIEKFLGLADD